eukprot:12816417-Alexandrium_andersonii.AAC.1
MPSGAWRVTGRAFSTQHMKLRLTLRVTFPRSPRLPQSFAGPSPGVRSEKTAFPPTSTRPRRPRTPASCTLCI